MRKFICLQGRLGIIPIIAISISIVLSINLVLTSVMHVSAEDELMQKVDQSDARNERLRGFSANLNERLKALGHENNRDVMEEAHRRPDHVLDLDFENHVAQEERQGLNQALGVADDNEDSIMDLPKQKINEIQIPGRRKEQVDAGDAGDEVAVLLMDALLDGAVIDDSGEMDQRGEIENSKENEYNGELDIDHFDVLTDTNSKVPSFINDEGFGHGGDIDSIMDAVSKKMSKAMLRLEEDVDSKFNLKTYVTLTFAVGKKLLKPLTIKMFVDDVPDVVRNFELLCDGSINKKDYLQSYDYVVMKLSEDKKMIKSSKMKGEGIHHFYENEVLPKDDVFSDLSFDVPGKLAMLRDDEGSDGSQFFLTLSDMTESDGNYNIFGEVVEGLDKAFVSSILKPNRQIRIEGCETLESVGDQ